MSVNTNRFIGYVLDVTDEYIEASKRDSEFYDKWIDSCPENDIERKAFLRGLGFKSYYDKDLKDNIILLYDGLNGQYAKLLYIIEYSMWTECDDLDENIIDCINKLLSEVKFSPEIVEQFKKIYKEMFNKECSTSGEIRTQYIVHYS